MNIHGKSWEGKYQELSIQCFNMFMTKGVIFLKFGVVGYLQGRLNRSFVAKAFLTCFVDFPNNGVQIGLFFKED